MNPIELLQGTFSFIFVIINITVGLIIISKYFKYNEHNLLIIGTAWAGMVLPWLPDAINLILILLNQPTLTDIPYMLIVFSIVPYIIFLWIIATTDILDINRRKLLLTIIFIFIVILDILVIIFIFVDTPIVGTLINAFTADFGFFGIFWLILDLILLGTFGFQIVKQSYKSNEKKIRLKGTFLLIAFISFITAALLDAIAGLIFPGEIIIIVFIRILLTSSAIEFYIGYIMPSSIERLFK